MWSPGQALAALPPGHALRRRAEDELAAVRPQLPTAQGMGAVSDPVGKVFRVGRTTLAFGADGSLTHFAVRDVAISGKPLLAFRYRTYNGADYDAFMLNYSTVNPPPGFYPKDFGKPGLGQVASRFWPTYLTGLSQTTACGLCTINFCTELNAFA